MKDEKNSKNLVVKIQINELWYLAKLFAPGLIFGVEDPSEGLSEEEMHSFDNQAYASLEKSGMVSYSKTGQLVVDEMLGAMVYSCIHSKDVLILTNKNSNQKTYYHFLPNWQLGLEKESDVYKLTHFLDRENLLFSISENLNLRSNRFGEKQEFFFNTRELELAAFLYDSGKEENALSILAENHNGKISGINEFLEGYNKPEIHFSLELIFARNSENSIIQEHYEILQTRYNLYWLSQLVINEDAEKATYVQNILIDELNSLINDLIP